MSGVLQFGTIQLEACFLVLYKRVNTFMEQIQEAAIWSLILFLWTTLSVCDSDAVVIRVVQQFTNLMKVQPHAD